MARRTITLRIGNEVGVGEAQTVIGKAKFFLLPPDHTVSGIIEDEYDEVEAEPDRGFHLLRIHHEPAIAAYGEHAALGRQHRCHHRRGETRSHRRQRVVEQNRVRLMRDIVAGEPDLVDAVVECDDVVAAHDRPYICNDALGHHRKAAIVAALADVRRDVLMDFGVGCRVTRVFAAQPVS